MALAAVTGATGFLGARLVGALAADGWDVRALVRRPPAAGLWGGAAPRLVSGDLADAAALSRLCDGADVVIHGAGLIKARSAAAFHEVNAEGARRLAQGAGGARVLLISSLVAREPQLSPYAASKRAGEEVARSVLGERLAVVRPPAIYGPGDRETLVAFRLAARGALMPHPTRGRTALAHVDDVAEAILAIARDTALSGTYAVGGHRPAGYAWREILEAAAQAVGQRARFAPAPAMLVNAAGAASEALGMLRREAPIFTRGKAREFLHPDWSVSPAEQAPGAPPARFNLNDGFADAVGWYRARGWLA